MSLAIALVSVTVGLLFLAYVCVHACACVNSLSVCRSLLPEVDAAMFEQWVLPFSREVIVASSSHPLVSGFYKLLGTCLTLCKKIGYFQVRMYVRCIPCEY